MKRLFRRWFGRKRALPDCLKHLPPKFNAKALALHMAEASGGRSEWL